MDHAYRYAALLLHEAGQEINETNVTNVLESANIDYTNARVKALIASLEGVDIDDVLQDASADHADESDGTVESATVEEDDADADDDGDDDFDDLALDDGEDDEDDFEDMF